MQRNAVYDSKFPLALQGTLQPSRWSTFANERDIVKGRYGSGSSRGLTLLMTVLKPLDSVSDCPGEPLLNPGLTFQDQCP